MIVRCNEGVLGKKFVLCFRRFGFVELYWSGENGVCFLFRSVDSIRGFRVVYFRFLFFVFVEFRMEGSFVKY